MSKRKLGLAILTALLCVCMAMVLVACGTQGEQGEKGEAGKDGISIESVEKVDSEGLTDTYKITYSDGSSTTFTVTNGKDGADGQTPFIGENGNWWIGSVDTGIPAKGQDGSDGEDGTDGADGQTPFIGENGNWWIGSVDTGVSAKGENGTDGKDGISITDVDINDAGELILYFSEGEPLNLGKIIGENGQDGEDGVNGVGVEGATIDENGNLILSLSNDTDINVGKVKGEDGQDGTDGKDGISITGVKIENGELIIAFSDGNSSNLGNIVGADGKDGVGIDRIELDENYNLTIYLTEGEPISLGCIRGEKGENGADGKSAYELYKEKFGYEGTEEQWLIDLANGNLAVVETHTIIFDAQGGSPVPEAQEIRHGEKLARPDDPTLEGFVFDGWYYQGEKWSFVGYVVTEDMTLTAQWSEVQEEVECGIISAEGFEFGTEEVNGQIVQTLSKTVANNVKSYDLANLIEVSDGCTWRLYSDFELQHDTNKIMANLADGENEGWLMVYSGEKQTRYKVNVYRRHIRNYTFQSEGETHTSGTIEEDHKLNIPETNPTNKAGYTFSHWTVDGEQVVFPYTVTVDTTFIAVFTPNNNTLHFDGNGATGGSMEDMTIATDASKNLTANGYVRAGYTFKGWAKSAGGAVEYTDGATYTMGTESEYTLYAVWEADNNTLRFDGNGATSGGMDDMTIATDASANLTTNAFERTGYTFEGWSTSAGGAVEYTDGALYTMGTESQYTLYAVWEIITYSITYDLDGGKWEQGENPNTFTIDDLPVKLNLTAPTKTEYAFFGWFDSAEFENEAPTEISNLGDVEIYAQFIAGTEGLQYREENGGYTVSGYTGSVNDVIIPDLHLDKPVLSIGDSAFENCSDLTSVTFGDNSQLTSIGDYAFYGCSNLTSVIFGENSQLSSIGEWAFSGCSSLTSIEIPSGVTSIGSGAFSGCSSLTSIEIPSGVASIGDSAFYYCSSLTSIEIPSGVTTIGGSAFQYCRGLASVTFGDNSQLTSIGREAFWCCSSMTSIEIPSGVTSIGREAFWCCSSLTSIEIPSSVTSIGYSAFFDCSGLTGVYISDIEAWCNIDFESYNSNPLYYAHNLYLNGELVTELVIPASTTTIGDYAFFDCSSLTSIEILSGVTSIGREAFYGCSNIDTINVASNNSVYKSDGNCLIEISTNTLIVGCKNSIIPNYVTSIGDSAFYDCSGLESIEIPSSVTSIGDYAFSDCSSLTSVIFGENSQLTSIGDYAFRNCSGLTSVIFGENSQLTSIGYYAFEGCSSLTSIEIPSGVTSIGDRAFYGCSELAIIFSNNSQLTSIDNSTFEGCSGLASVTFGDNSQLTSIGDSAFDGCSSLTSVIFGENSQLTSIGNSAFSGCSSLTSIEIPSGVTSIGSSAFEGCSNLTSVIFGENSQLTSIGDYAFRACSSLTSIEIPSGVTSIGDNAFYSCSGLTGVYISDIAAWCNIDFGDNFSNPLYYAHNLYFNGELVTDLVIPDSVTSIGSSAFWGCSSMTSIEIPSGVTTIGDRVFSGCSSLTSIEIPNGVTSIGNSAFSDCSSLTSIEIPNGVTSIGRNAFYGCSNLTSVIFGDNSQLTSIGDYAFYRCTGLTSIEIPSGVTSIGSYAFEDCSNLKTVFYGGVSEENWNSISINRYSNFELTSATRYYYSVNEPPVNEDGTAYNGNYWRYVDGVPTIWVKEQ